MIDVVILLTFSAIEVVSGCTTFFLNGGRNIRYTRRKKSLVTRQEHVELLLDKIFIHLVEKEEYYYNNELWKLGQNKNGSFEWNRILIKNKKKTPYPRARHSGWEYDGKLWTFGGHSHFVNIDDYLNEHGDFKRGWHNQLLHFDPVSNEWTNLQCFGAVPAPQSAHATTVLGAKVWLKSHSVFCFGQADPIYQLDMCSLTWTHIQTTTPRPPTLARACSLNVTRENQLVIHGKPHEDCHSFEHTWILDLSSYTWTKYSHNDCFRNYHTGSLGFNNSIIIIGGTFDHHLGLNKCVPMCNIMLEPKSLQQLSIQTVYSIVVNFL